MNKKASLFLATTVILLGGCAVTPENCDPSSGGFIKGVTCKVSGSYDKRIKQREDELSDLQKQQKALGTTSDELKTEHTAKSLLVVEEQEEVRQLGIQITTFQDRLDSAANMSKREQSQQQDLLTQLANLQAKAKRLEAILATPSISTVEYEQAKRENEQLRRELDNLMDKADAAQM